MDFTQILDGAEVLSRSGEAEIAGLDYDSRRIQPGFLFLAMAGESTDGNLYIGTAIQAGAVAVVTDSADPTSAKGGQMWATKIPWARVAHGRRALARLSANFYRHPAEQLAIAGITGTNGKTTTAFLLESILRAAGRKTALVGTVEYHVAGRVMEAPHTTPEALELNRLFADALAAGAQDAVMEVSSHALAQERVFGMPFDVAVFTNLTRDHLDYHGDMNSYFASKRALFAGCGVAPPRVAVINADDDHGNELAAFSRKLGSQVITYSLCGPADFCARNLQSGTLHTRFMMQSPAGEVDLVSALVGRVNAYNILAAAAAALARGCSLEEVRAGAQRIERVPGRFECVDCGQPYTVVVDYAHTDDALRNLTALARELVQAQVSAKIGREPGARPCGRVITLFGCGGDRDRSKRPLMGGAAGQGSDFVVLTNDNPRSEDPERIIADALPGLRKTGTAYAVELDRRRAIELALAAARPGDIVLLAGKGHEKFQITGEGKIAFDDVAVAREVLHAAGYTEDLAAVPSVGGPP